MYRQTDTQTHYNPQKIIPPHIRTNKKQTSCHLREIFNGGLEVFSAKRSISLPNKIKVMVDTHASSVCSVAFFIFIYGNLIEYRMQARHTSIRAARMQSQETAFMLRLYCRPRHAIDLGLSSCSVGRFSWRCGRLHVATLLQTLLHCSTKKYCDLQALSIS